MNFPAYTVKHPTHATLADVHALVPDSQEAQLRLEQTRERLSAGQLQLEQFLILSSPQGVQGVALISAAAQVPVIPRIRAGLPAVAVTQFAEAIRDRVSAGRRLVLQDDLARLDPAPLRSAGWLHESSDVVYETDLQACAGALDPDIQTLHPDALTRADVQTLLSQLGRPEFSLRDGWALLSLNGPDGSLAALGACGPSRPGWGSIDLIGVRPGARGQGLGSRLHAHMLARLAQQHARHGGITAQDNAAMRRIFARNGSRQTQTRLYFRLPEPVDPGRQP